MKNGKSSDDDKPNRPAQKTKKNVSFSELVTVNLLHFIPEIDISPQAKNLRARNDESFQAHRRQMETKLTRSGNGCSSDTDVLNGSSAVPLANTDGLVTPERMMHQRQAILAILSYQHRLNQMPNTFSLKNSRETATAALTSNTPLIDHGNIKHNKNNAIETLLSRASRKFSQRAKDIALEVARLNCLEVYPERKDLAQPISPSALFAERTRADSKTTAEKPSSFATSAWQSSGLPTMKLSVPIAISEFPTIKQKKKRCRQDDDMGGSSDESGTKNLSSKDSAETTGAAKNATPIQDHSTTNCEDSEEKSQIHYSQNNPTSGIKSEDGLVALSSLEKSILGPLKKRYRGNAAA